MGNRVCFWKTIRGIRTEDFALSLVEQILNLELWSSVFSFYWFVVFLVFWLAIFAGAEVRPTLKRRQGTLNHSTQKKRAGALR
jgi:hypothetical protein